MAALEGQLIFACLGGSQAQGTATDGSDVDIRGVCVAPLRTRLSFFESFEQFEGALEEPLTSQLMPALQRHPSARHALAVKVEVVVHDVAKFLRLCAAANPSALELLYTHRDDWLFESPAWRLVWEERERFLTARSQETFVAYGLAQLKRLKKHRARLQHADPQALNPGRNPARAALERAHGYDTKHAMHLVRLLRMGAELLRERTLHVRRADAAELLAIRAGALSFEELEALVADLQREMHAAASASRLPDHVDTAFVDALAYRLMTSGTAGPG